MSDLTTSISTHLNTKKLRLSKFEFLILLKHNIVYVNIQKLNELPVEIYKHLKKTSIHKKCTETARAPDRGSLLITMEFT